MQITLIVGNGFDLSLGLKTSYNDFYQWLEKRICVGGSFLDIVKEITKEKTVGNWGDYEILLGAILGGGIQERFLVQDFGFWKTEANRALIRYLDSIHTSDTVRDLINSKGIIQTYADILNRFLENQKEIFSLGWNGEKILLHLISLNYTDSLDQIAKGVSKILEKAGIWKIDTEVLHPHGTLYNENGTLHGVNGIILGVNDELQIGLNELRHHGILDDGNGAFNVDISSNIVREQPLFKGHLIKDQLIKVNKKCKNAKEKAFRAIDNSNIVCLYGLSLGESDNNWWKKLGTWLGKEEHRLIVFQHSQGIPINGAWETYSIIDKFLKNFALSGEVKNKRKKRISVMFYNNNENLFSLQVPGRKFILPIFREMDDLGLIYVSPGTFTMGSSDSEARKDETPHTVILLEDYWIGKYEVTQELYETVMGTKTQIIKPDKNPVKGVSWENARTFCQKLNNLFSSQLPSGYEFRLPTEAEWEYAARGGKMSKGYKYSGSNDIESVAWYNGNSGHIIHPVGGKSPNELGLYDMSGNVWEWCLDYYDSYPVKKVKNPLGRMGSEHVRRGGCMSREAELCRVSSRDARGPLECFDYIGFRIVLAPHMELGK